MAAVLCAAHRPEPGRPAPRASSPGPRPLTTATTSGTATRACRRTRSRSSCRPATATSGSARRKASSGSTACASPSSTRATPPRCKDDWVQDLVRDARRHALDRHADGPDARRRNGQFESVGEGTALERALIGSLLEAQRRDALDRLGRRPVPTPQRQADTARGSETDSRATASACALRGRVRRALVRAALAGSRTSTTESSRCARSGRGSPARLSRSPETARGGLWVGTGRGLVHVGGRRSTRLYAEADGL